jgi:hypothetical protein
VDPLCPEPGPPGDVYLCQVNARISCAACCGLYNVSDPSPTGLTALLARRSEMFAETSRRPEAILSFREAVLQLEDQTRPVKDFHHCPYIGLVEPDRRRAGCLLHPMAAGNDGADFRGLSYYGALACRIYFCPAHTALRATHKQIVQLCAGNWQLYGAVITEANLLRSFFGEVERRLGRSLATGDIRRNPAARDAVRRFLELKFDWPHRDAAYPAPLHYFFKDALCPKPAIDYGRLGVSRLRHHVILRELASAFRNTADLAAAERLIDKLIVDLAEAASCRRGP